MHNWIYNKKEQCGVDYADTKEAENYESRHKKFRDFEKEFSEMLKFLSLSNPKDKTIIDLGCGPGIFSNIATRFFKKVFAADISDAMLKAAQSKITANNIEFINAGFLSYRHNAEPTDLIITKMAFHHLPDFWKQIALLNINKMLKLNGVFYMHDVIFNFKATEYEERVNNWIADFELKGGKNSLTF